MKKIIYIRTSTELQTPQLQLRDIYKEFPQAKDAEIVEEQVSAFKETAKRPLFDELKRSISNGEVSEVFVWAWDRLERDYKRLNSFFALCKKTELHPNVKVHSVQEIVFEQFIGLPEPFDTMLTDMMQTITGYMGQMESKKKSDRIKLAVVKHNNKLTVSDKGNKWGRKRKNTERDNQIIALRESGKTYPEIANETGVNIGTCSKVFRRVR